MKTWTLRGCGGRNTGPLSSLLPGTTQPAKPDVRRCDSLEPLGFRCAREWVTLRWGRSFAIKVSARDLEELGIRFVLDNGLPWARACEEVLEPHDERMYRQTDRQVDVLPLID